MNNPTLDSGLQEATTALCNLLAESPQVIAAKARIGLFFQNPDATKLFEEVNSYGEELRNKHLAGMPPTEEEIAKFDELRQSVVNNELARGFLESRQSIDGILSTINQYLGMSIDLGRAPTAEEVAEARQKASSGGCGCGCGDEGCGDEGCGDEGCGDDCDCDGDCKDGGECGCK